MKLSTYALIFAAAASGLAFGAATAYTTPVGYITVAVPANADTTIAPSLSQAPLLQAASTGIAGDVITVAATGAATDAFINALPDTNSKTYVLVITGPLAGLRYPVTANTATTVTVNAGATTLATQGFVSGNQIAVVPYWTLNTLFPAGAGVGQTSGDILNPSSWVLFSDQTNVGANRGSSALYIYWAGGPDSGGQGDFAAGWYIDGNPWDGTKDTVALDPAVMMTIRTTPANSLTISGTVPSAPLATRLLTATETNDEYLACPYPIDTSLGDSNLSSVVAAESADILNPTEFVFVYDDTAAGQNKAASAQYMYWAGGTDPAQGDFAAGWYINGDPWSGVVTDKVLKAGRCFTVRKAAAGSASSAIWTAALPYSITAP